MKEMLKRDLVDLMSVPGLSGHEDRVRRMLQQRLSELGIKSSSDTLGNLHAHFAGDGPRVMLFAHMDQLGFIVRKIEANGLLRLERLGGVPERALAAQEVLVCVAEGRGCARYHCQQKPSCHHAIGEIHGDALCRALR